MASKHATFRITSTNGRWGWELKGRNGALLAVSPAKGYATKRGARDAVHAVAGEADSAELDD